MKNYYFDYAATTPIDPVVVEKMTQFLGLEGQFGNPASTHVFGQDAKRAVDIAREQVADAIGAEASEIVWTSGATESNNLAIKGAAKLYQNKGKHIITCKTEHVSVLDTCQQLEKEGFEVTYLDPEPSGQIDIHKFSGALRADTILVSLMHINNETGVWHDIEKIAAITATRNILLHVDAAQSIGKKDLDVKNIPIDLISLCAHKTYGPKGIGALYLRKKPRVKVAALLHGGGQENGMRAGTLATHQIVGMGEAFQIAKQLQKQEVEHVQQLRETLLAEIGDIATLNASLEESVPHIVNLQFKKNGKEIMAAMPQIAVSMGSACLSKGNEASYVLRAMGLSETQANNSIRFSLGRFTNESDVKKLSQILKSI